MIAATTEPVKGPKVLRIVGQAYNLTA